MIESFPSVIPDWWRPGARYLFGLARRTLVESLYLLSAPVIGVAGLLLTLGGLCAGTAGSLVPGGSRIVASALAPVRWSADVERWRMAKVRPPSPGARASGRDQRSYPPRPIRGCGPARRTRWRCCPSPWSPPW